MEQLNEINMKIPGVPEIGEIQLSHTTFLQGPIPVPLSPRATLSQTPEDQISHYISYL